MSGPPAGSVIDTHRAGVRRGGPRRLRWFDERGPAGTIAATPLLHRDLSAQVLHPGGLQRVKRPGLGRDQQSGLPWCARQPLALRDFDMGAMLTVAACVVDSSRRTRRKMRPEMRPARCGGEPIA